MKTLSLLSFIVTLVFGSYATNLSAAIEEDVQELLKKGEYRNALTMIEQGLDKDATNQKLLLAKGYLLVKLNQLNAATAYYRILKGYLKKNPEPGNNLAMIYRMQGKYQQAIKQFDETIEAFPDYAHAYENLGDTYIELAQSKYQIGFEKSGDTLLQQKITLSKSFHQVAIGSSATPEPAEPTPTPTTVATTKSKPESRPKPKPTLKSAPAASEAVVTTSIANQDTTFNTAQTKDGVSKALESWVHDWMSRDADRYLSHYSNKFIPSNGQTLTQWLAHKKSVLSTAGAIKLKLSNIDIKFEPQGQAIAIFTQEYESKTFKDTSRKTLRLEKSMGRWIILSENSESA